MTEISRLLAKIENYEMVLPEFQREFTWSKRQSLELIDSLLKNYPIGSLLVWRTADVPALKNMPDFSSNGRVDVLLDGQQRLTALYMLVKDAIPPYYSPRDIDTSKDPRNLYFNLETRALGYYKRIEMQNNPRWVRVLDCFRSGAIDLKDIASQIAGDEGDRFEIYSRINGNYSDLRAIREIPHPVMYVQEDADLKHALTVFDRVNSNGTPLTEADIALAHMCSAWSETRRIFKEKLAQLSKHHFNFDLTFLIRAMNAVVNGRAEYRVLHDSTREQLVAGWNALDEILDYLVNLLRDRAYIYESDDINTHNVLIPIIGYLAQNSMQFQSDAERRKLLYWMYAALYQTRYSGSVDQKLERDLSALSSSEPVEQLIAVLREDHGDSMVTPENLDTRGVGHPLYNMSCIVIRATGGLDWSNGLSLQQPVGKAFNLERHHIFPQAVLSGAGYDAGRNLIHRKRVNEIANRIPITHRGNMDIFDKPPEEYLPIVQESNPGNLEKFMIPTDTSLWTVNNYEAFLDQRRKLISDAINRFMKELIDNESSLVSLPSNTVADVLKVGECETVEFKSSLRWNIHASRYGKEIENAVLKTICAFLNSDGGTLLIGLDDSGKPLGLDLEGFENEDKMMLHLTSIMKDRVGARFVRFLRMEVEHLYGIPVFRINCQPAVIPAYLSSGNSEHFYVRAGPSTVELPASEIHEYVQSRFYE